MYCYVEYAVLTRGVREGNLLGGGTICPKNKQFALKLTFLV